MSAGQQLREAMAKELVVAPFVYDGFTAKIAAAHGFRACYMSGHATAAQLGMTDAGLISFGEVITNLRYVSNAVQVPVIADADTGYGNPINVRRTVQEYEAAGAAALHLEDQVFPKKCGFFEGKQVIAREEAAQKIRAAVEARRDASFVIIARTDALAVEGWDGALARIEAYREAGADLLFVDGIDTIERLDRYSEALAGQGFPCVYNGILEPAASIAARGFRLMITGLAHRLSFLALRQALRELRRSGQQASLSQSGQFQAVTDLLDLPEIYALEERYAVR